MVYLVYCIAVHVHLHAIEKPIRREKNGCLHAWIHNYTMKIKIY